MLCVVALLRQVGLAGGVETMSSNPMAWEGGINPRVGDFPGAASCMLPMGVTSENVAAKYGVDRKTQVRGARLWLCVRCPGVTWAVVGGGLRGMAELYCAKDARLRTCSAVGLFLRSPS